MIVTFCRTDSSVAQEFLALASEEKRLSDSKNAIYCILWRQILLMGIHRFPLWRLACSVRKKSASSLVVFGESTFRGSFIFS